MKKRMCVFLPIMLLLYGCSPVETAIESAITQTEVGQPTSTITPEPTNTPEPSPTSKPTITHTPIPSPTCSPFLYSEPEVILTIQTEGTTSILAAADFNADGRMDIVLTRDIFMSAETFEIEILLNDSNGSLRIGTAEVFDGPIAKSQFPGQLLVDDFNGDGQPDIFIADQGQDANPFPGYQNRLVLSSPGGKLIDATGNLPHQNDFSHSAASADIDGDGDQRRDWIVGQFNSTSSGDVHRSVDPSPKCVPGFCLPDLVHESSCAGRIAVAYSSRSNSRSGLECITRTSPNSSVRLAQCCLERIDRAQIERNTVIGDVSANQNGNRNQDTEKH